MKNDILDWFQGQVTWVQRKFSSLEDKPVYFDDYNIYEPDIWYILFPGCDAKFSERTTDRFLLHCRMKQGVTLPIHHHPDYTELFTIIKGQLTDLESDTILNSNKPPFLFKNNISHTMRCDEDCLMIIECKRIDNA